jgi:hypothetical protein
MSRGGLADISRGPGAPSSDLPPQVQVGRGSGEIMISSEGDDVYEVTRYHMPSFEFSPPLRRCLSNNLKEDMENDLGMDWLEIYGITCTQNSNSCCVQNTM